VDFVSVIQDQFFLIYCCPKFKFGFYDIAYPTATASIFLNYYTPIIVSKNLSETACDAVVNFERVCTLLDHCYDVCLEKTNLPTLIYIPPECFLVGFAVLKSTSVLIKLDSLLVIGTIGFSISLNPK